MRLAGGGVIVREGRGEVPRRTFGFFFGHPFLRWGRGGEEVGEERGKDGKGDCEG